MNPTPTKIKTTAIKIVPRYARSALDDVFADIVEDSWLKLLWQQPRTLTGAGEAVNAGRADFM